MKGMARQREASGVADHEPERDDVRVPTVADLAREVQAAALGAVGDERRHEDRAVREARVQGGRRGGG